MMPEDCFTKQQWRARMRERLAVLSEVDRHNANLQIHEAFRCLNWVQNAAVVMLYYSINREVETVSMITELLARGQRVALPVCTAGCNLVAKEIQHLAEVGPTGKFGLSEPLPQTPEVVPDQIELVVVPGVAFDQSGNRLGHGNGYYDRYLNRAGLRTVKLGLAYDFQVVEQLPVDDLDVKMDALLTPSGLLII
jgi:5-formyltetrahydrofolate cyclo-ligase